ncbi:hypothetical protein SAMN04489718_3149 [Actinopolyspora saharensis]|uniref:Uncharacterized protein n=1 Tax=Actinopolyspora saharensis TaxID=995062 RepID=A0A1H1FP40_9ACTN|nr:hypothetical protein SAMN04489718_3149 [Actinopolyspora saharensis]
MHSRGATFREGLAQRSPTCEFPHPKPPENHSKVGLCTVSTLPRADQRQGSNRPHAVHKPPRVAHRCSPSCPQDVHRFIHNLIEGNSVIHRRWGQPGQILGIDCGSNPPQLWTARLVDKSIHIEADSSPDCPQEHPQRCTASKLRKTGLSPTSTSPTTVTALLNLLIGKKRRRRARADVDERLPPPSDTPDWPRTRVVSTQRTLYRGRPIELLRAAGGVPTPVGVLGTTRPRTRFGPR